MYIVDKVADFLGISRYFARFLVTGGINTAFGYFAFCFFIFLGFNDFLAPLFATIVGVLFNFQTIGGLVFNDRSKNLLWKFFIVYSITYGLNVFGLKLFAYFGIENRYISGLILVFPIAMVSYFLNKKYVFNK